MMHTVQPMEAVRWQAFVIKVKVAVPCNYDFDHRSLRNIGLSLLLINNIYIIMAMKMSDVPNEIICERFGLLPYTILKKTTK